MDLACRPWMKGLEAWDWGQTWYSGWSHIDLSIPTDPIPKWVPSEPHKKVLTVTPWEQFSPDHIPYIKWKQLYFPFLRKEFERSTGSIFWTNLKTIIQLRNSSHNSSPSLVHPTKRGLLSLLLAKIKHIIFQISCDLKKKNVIQVGNKQDNKIYQWWEFK